MSTARVGSYGPLPPDDGSHSSAPFHERFRRRFEELEQIRRERPEEMTKELMHDLLLDDLTEGVEAAYRLGRRDAATDRVISVLEDMLEKANDKEYRGYDGSLIREFLTRLNEGSKTILSSDIAERMLERLYNSHKNEENGNLMFWLSFFTREGFVDKHTINQYYRDHYRELCQKKTDAKCHEFIETNINRQPLSRTAESRLHVLQNAKVKLGPTKQIQSLVRQTIPSVPSIQEFLSAFEKLRLEEKKAKEKLDSLSEMGSMESQKEARIEWNRKVAICDQMRVKATQLDRGLLREACREKFFRLDRGKQEVIQNQIAEIRKKGEIGALYGPENILEEMPPEFEAYYYASGGAQKSASIIAAAEAMEQVIMPGFRRD